LDVILTQSNQILTIAVAPTVSVTLKNNLPVSDYDFFIVQFVRDVGAPECVVVVVVI